MRSRLILIVLDGLRFDIATTCMGYLAHLVERQQASLYKVQAELPTLSRPLYEVLLTGVPASVSGIVANDVARLSNQVSVFHLASQQGLITAAAAYSWFAELYNQAPFDPVRNRQQHDKTLPIQHGIFYWEDTYPDSHLFADAEVLIRSCNPDFLLVHPMGIDNAGHFFGSDSKEYRGQALLMDNLLAHAVPRWREAGYEIAIVSDHGMNPDGNHGGNLPDVREVPLFGIGESFTPGLYLDGLSQLAIAPALCQLLGVPLAPSMQSIHMPGFVPGVLPTDASGLRGAGSRKERAIGVT